MFNGGHVVPATYDKNAPVCSDRRVFYALARET
jgi:hypothetical protein